MSENEEVKHAGLSHVNKRTLAESAWVNATSSGSEFVEFEDLIEKETGSVEFSPGVHATIALWNERRATEANMQRADEPVNYGDGVSIARQWVAKHLAHVCIALEEGFMAADDAARLRAALAAYDALVAPQTPVATPSKPSVPLTALRAHHVPGYGGLR